MRPPPPLGLQGRYVLWGYENSWVVSFVDLAGQTVWRSPWHRCRADAERTLTQLQQGQPATREPPDPS